MTPFTFANRYAQLPSAFFARQLPIPVAAPTLITFNSALAEELGYQGSVEAEQLARWFSGNEVIPGADPLAQAYAGHQFGHFVPQLGDGRAILLGDVLDVRGQVRDLQLKGAGRTPFSRGGDGRAPIGPVLREYLLSEAMHALGVPTTRALAAVTTGERIFRDVSVPGAILTRVAASHIRIGTFQFFAARGNKTALHALTEHSLARHYPDRLQDPVPTMALLEEVVKRQAALVAHWMGLGFIHGVMNTDNMTISGETIDYGPCAFMENYAPDRVFSSIDRDGRYAYDQQPGIAQWNLARLAEALLNADEDPNTHLAEAERIIGSFKTHYDAAWLAVFGAKLGLTHVESDDRVLIERYLAELHQSDQDFTRGFASLLSTLKQLPTDVWVSEDWLADWQARLARDGTTPEQQFALLQRSNPVVIPRNHWVATVIQAAEDHADFTPFKALLAAVTRPFEHPDNSAYEQPAPPEERVFRTFCGT
ncbi:YdiU family protein [Salinispirillum marinum]|uniref:Protein nucleotidyltransferase YdiU n=2 Tax=Saccharospirillaceae TaxID=255527 RepID=A0ABV8BAC7_9GAMM